jgi:hypothetical protein
MIAESGHRPNELTSHRRDSCTGTGGQGGVLRSDPSVGKCMEMRVKFRNERLWMLKRICLRFDSF